MAGREATARWLLHFLGRPGISGTRTCVYVDGFNLYYGALRHTPYRWLNLAALCKLYVPKNDIQKIKYFTASVSARPDDPDQPARQQLYLRALQTLPEVEIYFGHFLTNPHKLDLAPCPPERTPDPNVVYLVAGGPRKARVFRTDEKGSDVNLATHLLHDAFQDRYDVAVVITNDSDLRAPLLLARDVYKKEVGVLNPQKNASRELAAAATFTKKIRGRALALCMFSDSLTDANGPFHKPPVW